MGNHVTIRKVARAKQLVTVLSLMEEPVFDLQDYRRAYKAHFGVNLTLHIAQAHIDVGREQGLIEIHALGNAQKHTRYREARTAPTPRSPRNPSSNEGL